MSNNTSRRNFLRTTSLGGMLSISLPGIVSAAFEEQKVKKISLSKGDIILFQGDSITDSSRKKDEPAVNNSAALGKGYSFLAASDLLNKYPEKDLQIYNRGISGNKVFQLADRWDADCLDLKPNVLSILVGVNDFWHTITNKYAGTIETYRTDYDKLLDRTKQKLPGVKLIIGEPYAVIGVKAVTKDWYPAFDEYRHAARELADKYGAAFIPYQAIYDKAQKSAPGSYWTPDGVHPGLAGAALMTEAWLEMVKG